MNEEPFNEDEAMEDVREAEREARYPTPLPNDGDRLFKADPERVWMHNTFSPRKTYLDGYAWAADFLFNEAQRSAREAKERSGVEEPLNSSHWLVYPMYFLYRHAIELGLKDVLRLQKKHGELNMEQEKLIDGCHDPWKLWEAAKPWVTTFTRELSAETPAFESMLREIEMWDANAEAGRYSESKMRAKGKKQLVASFPDLSPLDINVLRSNAIKMLNYITWIGTLYEDNSSQG